MHFSRRCNPLPSLALALLALGCGGPAFAARDERIHAAAVRQQAPALELLERLVNIDSPTGHGPGLEAVGKLLGQELSAIGGRVEFVTAAPMSGRNLVATFNGTGKGRVLMVAHSDTVWPVGEAARRPFRIEGNRARGPGVSDDKGGIVAAVSALRILHELGLESYGTLTLVGVQFVGNPFFELNKFKLIRRSAIWPRCPKRSHPANWTDRV